MLNTGIRCFIILLGLLWIPTASLSLPNCPSDQTERYHNCFGTYTNADGDTYVGEYKDDKKNGLGTYTFADGDTYVGEFTDDKRDGQGFYLFKDSRADFCFYTDNEDSNCSGTNVYDVASNLTKKFRQMSESQRKKIQSNLKSNGFYTSVVDGKWGHDTFKALATHAALKLKTVNINTASSANNLLQSVLRTGSSSDHSCPTDASVSWDNCVGSYTFENGGKYVGEWKDNKKHGQGTYTYSDGSIYVGQLENGDFNGQGSLILSNGDKYVGEFKDDNFHGQGTYTYGPRSEWAGDQYVGQWRNDKKHGLGTYIFVDGTRKIGLWESGEFQGPEVVENVNPDETREVASGTGFYVSEDGHIITNHHVIDGCMDIKVQSQGELIPTIRLAEDKQNDLALLKVSQEPNYVFALSNDSPYPLQEIVVAGFPFGDRYSSTLKFTKGIVSSLAGLGDNYSEIQIDAALQQGNSGGPIIDEYGNVVAVAVAKLDAKYMFENFGIIPENTNFGVKASAARNLLEANRVNLKASSNELISKRDLSSIAADGTVYLTCWMTNAQLEQMKSKKVMFQNLD